MFNTTLIEFIYDQIRSIKTGLPNALVHRKCKLGDSSELDKGLGMVAISSTDLSPTVLVCGVFRG